MSRILTAALPLITAVLLSSATPAARANEFASANGHFSVELTLTPEKEILVAIFQATNDTKALHWSRATKWEEPEHGWNTWNTSSVSEIKALVTNDGNTVVLRDNNTTSQKNGIRIIQKSPAKDHAAHPFRPELTGVEPDQPRSGRVEFPRTHRPGQLRMGTSYLHVTSLLDFIFEEKNSYALWFGQTDQWLLISLTDFKETIVRNADTLNALNKIAYAKAKNLVLLHQPPPLRKIIGSLRNRIAEFVPSLSTPTSRGYMGGDTTAAYLFLTARRMRSDASLIERLVSFPPEEIQRGHGPLSERIDLDFSVSYSQRVIGDYLWSRWNGDTNREIIAREMYQLLPQDTFRYLGSISFNLEFPFDLPSTNIGGIWAYIIPAEVSAEKWKGSKELLAFYNMLSLHPHRPRSSTVGRDGKVDIRALTPGTYRAKFIWERTPSNKMWWRTNIYLGTTNDYESAFTQPITVKAGETITNIPIAITNFISQTSPQKP